jgi:hypothetical protein
MLWKRGIGPVLDQLLAFLEKGQSTSVAVRKKNGYLAVQLFAVLDDGSNIISFKAATFSIFC